jgi:hypothetical protein
MTISITASVVAQAILFDNKSNDNLQHLELTLALNEEISSQHIDEIGNDSHVIKLLLKKGDADDWIKRDLFAISHQIKISNLTLVQNNTTGESHFSLTSANDFKHSVEFVNTPYAVGEDKSRAVGLFPVNPIKNSLCASLTGNLARDPSSVPNKTDSSLTDVTILIASVSKRYQSIEQQAETRIFDFFVFKVILNKKEMIEFTKKSLLKGNTIQLNDLILLQLEPNVHNEKKYVNNIFTLPSDKSLSSIVKLSK